MFQRYFRNMFYDFCMCRTECQYILFLWHQCTQNYQFYCYLSLFSQFFPKILKYMRVVICVQKLSISHNDLT